MPRVATKPRIGQDMLVRWEACWETLLRLPLDNPPETDFHEAATRVVRSCRHDTSDRGLPWIEEQVADSHEFVNDRLVAEPEDVHWARLLEMLDGAAAALR